MKKIISILIAICMVITLVPAISATGTAYGQDVAVKRTERLDLVPDPSDPEGNFAKWKSGCTQDGNLWTNASQRWSWNTETKMLFLDGVDFDMNLTGGYAIKLPEDSVVVLTGQNKFKYETTNNAIAIGAMESISFLGNGSLDMNIKGGTNARSIELSGTREKKQIIIGSENDTPYVKIFVECVEDYYEALTAPYGGTVEVNNGTLELEKADSISSSGSRALSTGELYVGPNATLIAKSGKGSRSYAVVCNKANIEGALKLTTGEAEKMAAGIFTDECYGINVSGNGRIEYSGARPANIVDFSEDYRPLGVAGPVISNPIAIFAFISYVPKQDWYIVGGKADKSLSINYEGTKYYSIVVEQTGNTPVVLHASKPQPAPISLKGNLTTYYSKTGGYNDVKLSWTKHQEAAAYKVYFKKGSAKNYTYLGQTTKTVRYIKDLNPGAKYTFKVVPCKGSTKYSYKTVVVYTLKKLNAPSVTRSGSKVKVKWTNIAGETGYQISKSTSKTGTNIVATYATTSGNYKTLSATKGKKYYYKVRAYKTVNGTKIYGPWSYVRAFTR